MSNAVSDDDPIVLIRSTKPVIGLSPSTVRRRMATDKTFPRPRRLGTAPNSPLGWRRSQLLAWFASRPEA